MPLHAWIILGVVFIFVAPFLFGLFYSYGRAFYQSNKQKQLSPYEFFGNEQSAFCREPMHALVDELMHTPCEEITIKSRDGLRLFGRFYRFTERDDRVEILFHGWRSNGIRDASGGAKMARDNGYNVLIVDQRAHGKSEGHTMGFGYLERYDCMDWTKYVINRFGPNVSILLSGVSMGASTVLMASELPELPPQVKAITADCSFSTPRAILDKTCREVKLPHALGLPMLRLSARLIGGFSIRTGGAAEAVRNARVPIMIMHGDGDTFVPCEMGYEIYNACTSEKRLLIIPRAEHGLSYFYDTERYVREVTAFNLEMFER